MKKVGRIIQGALTGNKVKRDRKKISKELRRARRTKARQLKRWNKEQEAARRRKHR